MSDPEKSRSLEELNEVVKNHLKEQIEKHGFHERLLWPRIVASEKDERPDWLAPHTGRQVLLHPDGRLTVKTYSRHRDSEEKQWNPEKDLPVEEYLQYAGKALVQVELDAKADETPGITVI